MINGELCCTYQEVFDRDRVGRVDGQGLGVEGERAAQLGGDEHAHRAQQLQVTLADWLNAEESVEDVHGQDEDVVGARLVVAHVQHPGGEHLSHPRLDLALDVQEVVALHAVVVLEAEQVLEHPLVVQQALGTQLVLLDRCSRLGLGRASLVNLHILVILADAAAAETVDGAQLLADTTVERAGLQGAWRRDARARAVRARLLVHAAAAVAAVSAISMLSGADDEGREEAGVLAKVDRVARRRYAKTACRRIVVFHSRFSEQTVCYSCCDCRESRGRFGQTLVIDNRR